MNPMVCLLISGGKGDIRRWTLLCGLSETCCGESGPVQTWYCADVGEQMFLAEKFFFSSLSSKQKNKKCLSQVRCRPSANVPNQNLNG